jgi:hypothetical protein
MRCLLLSLLLVFVGCKTAEVAVVYPPMGLQLVAKMEARDPQPMPLPKVESVSTSR